MIKITCDKCQKEINIQEKFGFIRLGTREGLVGNKEEQMHMDLCQECLDEFTKSLSGGG